MIMMRGRATMVRCRARVPGMRLASDSGPIALAGPPGHGFYIQPALKNIGISAYVHTL